MSTYLLGQFLSVLTLDLGREQLFETIKILRFFIEGRLSLDNRVCGRKGLPVHLHSIHATVAVTVLDRRLF